MRAEDGDSGSGSSGGGDGGSDDLPPQTVFPERRPKTYTLKKGQVFIPSSTPEFEVVDCLPRVVMVAELDEVQS